MKKSKILVLSSSIMLIIGCNQKNNEIKVSEENETKKNVVEQKTEKLKVLSKSEVIKMNINDQKKYLSEHYGLDYETLINMSGEQFPEFLELHLNGIFDKKSLNQSWKEYANLNEEDSKEFIKENFNDYKNMNIILSFYGPMFYNK